MCDWCREAGGSIMTFLVRLLEAEAEAGQSSDGTVRAALLPRAPLMVRRPKHPHCRSSRLKTG